MGAAPSRKMGGRKASLREVLERRLYRAGQLAELWPFAREVLEFFGALTQAQMEVLDRLPESIPPDPGFMTSFLSPVLDLVEREGPAGLAASLWPWRERSVEESQRALRAFWAAEPGEPAEQLISKAILLPYALKLASRWTEDEEGQRGAKPQGACPFCRHAPAAGVLREDKGAETTARSLVCSLCSQEWRFARVLCPSCLEERPEKLPRFTADEIPWIRIDACDTCRRYLKSVDFTRNPDAEAAVDELASTPLDILAREEGYEKLERNLMGM